MDYVEKKTKNKTIYTESVRQQELLVAWYCLEDNQLLIFHLAIKLSPTTLTELLMLEIKLSTDKQKPALNVGRTIGHLLANVCDSKHCIALQQRYTQGQENEKLLGNEWNSCMNRSALKQIQSEKRPNFMSFY